MTANISEPLRLAVGSHEAGSGKGCAMNVISWESGDSTISDMPACADPLLARIVQSVNDTHCTHTQDGLLCPPCSIEVLALAHRTVGTALDMEPAARAKVYVEIALGEAESVLHLTSSEAPRRTCALVRRWLEGEDVSPQQIRDSRRECASASASASAYDAAYAAYDASASASASAYDAAAAADAAYAAYAYAAAADAYADAAYAAYADAASGRPHLQHAHRIIDRLEAITGIKARTVEQETIEAAIEKMRLVNA